MKDLERMLREPVEVKIASYSITLFQLDLPSGARLRLTQGGVYTTSDPEDIDFLSKQKGLSVTKVGDAAYRRHFTKVFSTLPTVSNKILNPETVEEYMLTTDAEKAVVEELRKRGYTINKREVKTEVAYIKSSGVDKEILPTSTSKPKAAPKKKKAPVKKK